MKIGLKRLLKLADILDVADAEHLKRGEPAYDQAVFSHECGSPACALGHYAVSKRGWRLSERLILSNGESLWHDGATIQKEFAISEDEAEELFGALGCGLAQTAKQAAKYIRKFVARKQKELEQ